MGAEIHRNRRWDFPVPSLGIPASWGRLSTSRQMHDCHWTQLQLLVSGLVLTHYLGFFPVLTRYCSGQEIHIFWCICKDSRAGQAYSRSSQTWMATSILGTGTEPAPPGLEALPLTESTRKQLSSEPQLAPGRREPAAAAEWTVQNHSSELTQLLLPAARDGTNDTSRKASPSRAGAGEEMLAASQPRLLWNSHRGEQELSACAPPPLARGFLLSHPPWSEGLSQEEPPHPSAWAHSPLGLQVRSSKLGATAQQAGYDAWKHCYDCNP